MTTARNLTDRLRGINKRGFPIKKALKRLVVRRGGAKSASIGVQSAPICDGLAEIRVAPLGPSTCEDWITSFDIPDLFGCIDSVICNSACATTVSTTSSTVSIPDRFFDPAQPDTASASSSSTVSIPEHFFEPADNTTSASSLFSDPSEVSSSIDSHFSACSPCACRFHPSTNVVEANSDSHIPTSETDSTSSSDSFFHDFLAYISHNDDQGYESDEDSGKSTVSLAGSDSTVSIPDHFFEPALPVTSSASSLSVDPSEVSSLDSLFMDPSSVHSYDSIATSGIFRRAAIASLSDSITSIEGSSSSYYFGIDNGCNESDVDSEPIKKTTTVSPLKTVPCQEWKSRVLQKCDESLRILADLEKKLKKD